MAQQKTAPSASDCENLQRELAAATDRLVISNEQQNALRSFTKDEKDGAVYWNGCYAKSGRIWGLNPSETAVRLISAIRNGTPASTGRTRIVELGCGYGRDTFALAKAGFDVLAVDTAGQGLVLANQHYRQALSFDLPGRIHFLHGTIRTVAATTAKQFDGLACHRALHLMKKEDVINFARCASELLRPEGIMSIGARSRQDFDPETMEWVKGQESQTAKYRDKCRNGQFLRFLDEAFLRMAFGPYFDIHFWEGSEQERLSNPIATKLIFMIGTRKS